MICLSCDDVEAESDLWRKVWKFYRAREEMKQVGGQRVCFVVRRWAIIKEREQSETGSAYITDVSLAERQKLKSVKLSEKTSFRLK